MRERVMILTIIMLLPFLLYGGYLFSLQILRGYFYSQISEEQVQRTTRVPAMRGDIYERNYATVLAGNEASFEIYVISGELPEEIETFAAELAPLVKAEVSALTQELSSLKRNSRPYTIAKHVDRQSVFLLAENHARFPGVYWRESTYRVYPQRSSLSHIVGYVGDITREEYQVLYNQGYSLDSEIGKSGVEFAYDRVLKGEEGVYRRRTDARGQSLESQKIVQASQPGNDVVLTVDYKIQQLAEDALGARDGAVVVLDPDSGEVLAMVSYPRFDPNIFSSPHIEQGFTDLTLNARSPFLNRAVQTAVAPASTFKIAVAAALLEQEDFSSDYRVNCEGSKQFGDRVFHCWNERGHGYVNLQEAIAQSCNVYFYTAAVNYLSAEDIFETAYQFGFGRKTGVDLQSEKSGFIPTSEWKRVAEDESWHVGDTVNMSIGQGYVQVTPMQLALMISAIANGGYAYTPHLLKETRDHFSGVMLQHEDPEIALAVDLSEEDLTFLQEALRSVITDGTARVVINTDAVSVAGKTGTGQVSSADTGYTSWFMAYAPYNAQPGQRRIVLVVMVDGTNEWEWWAPKAANIILEGIYTDSSYEEAIERLRRQGKLWYM